MSIQAIVDEIDSLSGDDPELNHGRADQLLMAALRELGAPEVARAYENLIMRCNWWAWA